MRRQLLPGTATSSARKKTVVPEKAPRKISANALMADSIWTVSASHKGDMVDLTIIVDYQLARFPKKKQKHETPPDRLTKRTAANYLLARTDLAELCRFFPYPINLFHHKTETFYASTVEKITATKANPSLSLTGCLRAGLTRLWQGNKWLWK
tara:strand:- start:350 stop:808 length:459 start_codon:yes stop_codon:yes gene_type:complete